MKSKRIQLLLYCLIGFLALFGLVRLYYSLTDDFRLANMTYDMSKEPVWENFKLSQDETEKVAHILEQKFYYLGKGAQTYVFVSEDKQYVLKFFKFKHLKPHWALDLIPAIGSWKDYKARIIQKKKRQLHGLFKGYELAYALDKENSGLLFVHLNPTENIYRTVKVVDKIGLERHINLDKVVFLLQEKGETLRARITHQLDQGEVEEAKRSIAQVLTMYVGEYKRGVYDRDHGVMHNTGFVGNRPFHLDVGMLAQNPKIKVPEHYKKDLEHIVWKMDLWVERNYPNYYQEFSRFLADQFELHTGEKFDVKLLVTKRFQRYRFDEN